MFPGSPLEQHAAKSPNQQSSIVSHNSQKVLLFFASKKLNAKTIFVNRTPKAPLLANSNGAVLTFLRHVFTTESTRRVGMHRCIRDEQTSKQRARRMVCSERKKLRVSFAWKTVVRTQLSDSTDSTALHRMIHLEYRSRKQGNEIYSAVEWWGYSDAKTCER